MLEATSNFITEVGDGAGEAGRLEGLRNEGVLMACIAQVLGGCTVRCLMAVVKVAGSLKQKGGWRVSVYSVVG